MAARVFNLDELASRIAIHLLAMSPRTTLALALTCRALEVPALRALWETLGCLKFLIQHVGPADAQCYIFLRPSDLRLLVSPLSWPVGIFHTHPSRKYQQALERPLTAWELNRLKRYASWMRRLCVSEWGLSKEITQLVLSSPNGTPPALPFHLRELEWRLNETNFSFLPSFLSPYLTTITVTTDALIYPIESVDPWDKLPDEVLPTMRTAIKLFPSSPQTVHLKLGFGLETRLTEEVSAYVLASGESLRSFTTNVVLSTQAIVHLMQLPNLRFWTTEQGPPQVTDLINHGVTGAVSLFPALWEITLMDEVALEWLSIFEAAKNRDLPWIMAGDSLPMVSHDHPTLPIDFSLISRFLPFTDLVELRIMMGCMSGGPCVSHLTDEDVEHLVTALPKLEAVTLGEWPCDSDTCPTTIRSLLSFSIHCLKLRYLNIHFHTAYLQTDIMNMWCNGYSQGLHSRPKSSLTTLVTQGMPIDLSVHNPLFVSIGMLTIFPSLTRFVSSSSAWTRLEVGVKGLGLDPELPALTEKLMGILCRMKAQVAENPELLESSAVSPYLLFTSVGGLTDVALRSLLRDEVSELLSEVLLHVSGTWLANAC